MKATARMKQDMSNRFGWLASRIRPKTELVAEILYKGSKTSIFFCYYWHRFGRSFTVNVELRVIMEGPVQTKRKQCLNMDGYDLRQASE